MVSGHASLEQPNALFYFTSAAYRMASRNGLGPTLIHADQLAKGSKKGSKIAVLAIAGLLFAFGFIAQNVAEGTSFAFDKKIVAGFRDPGNPPARHGRKAFPSFHAVGQ